MFFFQDYTRTTGGGAKHVKCWGEGYLRLLSSLEIWCPLLKMFIDPLGGVVCGGVFIALKIVCLINSAHCEGGRSAVFFVLRTVLRR